MNNLANEFELNTVGSTVYNITGYKHVVLDEIKKQFNKANSEVNIDYICDVDKRMFWILKDKKRNKEIFSFGARATNKEEVTEKLAKVLNDYNKLT